MYGKPHKKNEKYEHLVVIAFPKNKNEQGE